MDCFKEIANNLLDIYANYKTKSVDDVVMFSQLWESTALGFSGIGGDMLTTAMTTVVFVVDGSADVYFRNRLAYTIKNPNNLFKEDLAKRQMKECSQCNLYEQKYN